MGGMELTNNGNLARQTQHGLHGFLPRSEPRIAILAGLTLKTPNRIHEKQGPGFEENRKKGLLIVCYPHWSAVITCFIMPIFPHDPVPSLPDRPSETLNIHP